MNLAGHVLYHSPTSPYVRKVAVLIAEAGITGVAQVAASGSPVDPGAMPLEQNPLGKIPALARPDGPALYDSRVICRYLDNLAGSGFYSAPPRLWDILTLEATADGILDAAVLMAYENRIRPEELRYQPWVAGQWAKIDRTLDAVTTGWMDHLNGPVDIGHIALGCALGYLDLRHSVRAWRATRPGLAAWMARFAARPAMVATTPEA